jgi:hypothetical protein
VAGPFLLEKAALDALVRVTEGAGDEGETLNVNFVDEFAKGFDGGYVARMKDPEKSSLPVSRRYKSRLNLTWRPRRHGS